MTCNSCWIKLRFKWWPGEKSFCRSIQKSALNDISTTLLKRIMLRDSWFVFREIYHIVSLHDLLFTWSIFKRINILLSWELVDKRFPNWTKFYWWVTMNAHLNETTPWTQISGVILEERVEKVYGLEDVEDFYEMNLLDVSRPLHPWSHSNYVHLHKTSTIIG